MAIKYQHSWLTNSNVSILELNISLKTSTYFSLVYFSKFPVSHLSPSTLSVHPVFDQAKVGAWTSTCHPMRWEDFLYIYIGGSAYPSAETHSVTVTISRENCLGIICNRMSLVIKTFTKKDYSFLFLYTK